jgi:hypothetical protein
MFIRRPLTAVALVAMSTAFLSFAHAASAAPAGAATSPSTSAIAPILSWKPRAWSPRVPAALHTASTGLRVAIDPIDGVMSMPLAPISSESVFVGDDPTPVQVDHYANGLMVAHLDDRFAQYSVVTVGSDGKPRWNCVTGPAQARKALVAPQPVLVAPAPGTVWEDQ